jgi:hypothetical protein
MHAQLSRRSDLIGIYTRAIIKTEDLLVEDFGDVRGSDKDASNISQIQYIYQGDNLRNVTGGSYTTNDVSSAVDFAGLFTESFNFDVSSWSAYSYLYLDAPQQMTWTLGGALVSYDEDLQDGVDVLEFLPKVGLRAEITDGLRVRASYLRSFKPRLVSEQILEPTSVAGFNQFYDAINGSLFDQIGGSIELVLSRNLTVGAEAIKRWWDVPPDAHTDEEVYRGYAYATLPGDFALAAEFVKERSKSDSLLDFEHWETTSIPLTLSYFAESGWFASAGVEFVDHSVVHFGTSGSDTFNLVNATVGLRLPNERGIISIGAQNLFDQPIHFQNRTLNPDIDAAPRYAPELSVQIQALISF